MSRQIFVYLHQRYYNRYSFPRKLQFYPMEVDRWTHVRFIAVFLETSFGEEDQKTRVSRSRVWARNRGAEARTLSGETRNCPQRLWCRYFAFPTGWWPLYALVLSSTTFMTNIGFSLRFTHPNMHLLNRCQRVKLSSPIVSIPIRTEDGKKINETCVVWNWTMIQQEIDQRCSRVLLHESI